MFAHGWETVSAQCLKPLVDAAESVRRLELPSGEPARHTKLRLTRRVRSPRGGEVLCHRLRVQTCRSSESAIVVDRHG